MDRISFGFGITISLEIELTETAIAISVCTICGLFLLIIFGFIIYGIYTCCNNKKYVVDDNDINDPNCDDDGEIEINTYNIAKNK